MVIPQYLIVLDELVARLGPTDICWALTGSLSFALQGIAVEIHDIDIQTDKTGAYAIARILSEYLTQEVAFSAAEKIRSHFGALQIGGVQVEIMGDIQKREADGSWEEPVDLEAHKRYVMAGDARVPVLDLEYEAQAYRKLGRIETAQIIEQEILRQFEAHLLKSEGRKAEQEVAKLLAEEFMEIGSSGRLYNKRQVIDSLQDDPPVRRSIADFRARELAPGVVLATYRVIRDRVSKEGKIGSLRSSIWKQIDGRWQIIFNQGTPLIE